MSELGKAQIIITNFHAFQRRERVQAAKLTKAILAKGDESPFTESEGGMVRRACRGLGAKKNIIVINDEAHHCYRRPQKAESEDGEKLVGDERKKENDHDWKWAKRLGELRNDRWHEAVAAQTDDGDLQGEILYLTNAKSFIEDLQGGGACRGAGDGAPKPSLVGAISVIQGRRRRTFAESGNPQLFARVARTNEPRRLRRRTNHRVLRTSRICHRRARRRFAEA